MFSMYCKDYGICKLTIFGMMFCYVYLDCDVCP